MSVAILVQGYYWHAKTTAGRFLCAYEALGTSKGMCQIIFLWKWANKLAHEHTQSLPCNNRNSYMYITYITMGNKLEGL